MPESRRRAARPPRVAPFALLAAVAAFAVASTTPARVDAGLPLPSLPAPLGSVASPIVAPVESAVDPLTTAVSSIVPLPSVRLPTLPLPTLPLPTLPLPTLPVPTAPLPTPTLPLATPTPGLPSGGSLAAPSPGPESSAGATPGSSASAGAAPTVAPPLGPVAPPPPGTPPAESSFLGLSVPALALGATGLILALIVIVVQAVGAVAWLPVVRRTIGQFGFTRPRRRRAG